MGSKSFYFATRFFPAELARSAHAVYWFCRTTDDLADECASIEQGRRDLEAWARGLDQALLDGDSPDPVLRLFAHTARMHGIPHEYPRELIEGMRMDLNGTRYATFAELRVFCYRVASIVGLMMCHVIGFVPGADRAEGVARAIDLGIAMQLTNILRDVGEDLDRGRVYFPQEDLDRFGYTRAMLESRTRNAAFRELMRFETARARDFYQRAEPGIPLLDPRGRFSVRIAADVYAAILRQIEAVDYDSFTRRAMVPAVEKYWLTARSLAGPLLRRVAAGGA